MLLLRNSEPRQLFVHHCGQRSQLRSAFNSHPERPWRACSRKESIPANAHFERAGLNRRQRASNALNLFFRLLSDELQRKVQRFRPYPARLLCKPTHSLEEAADAFTNSVVDIDSNEKPHKSARSQ